MNDLKQLFQQACQAQQAGNMQEAETLYKSILEQEPGHESSLYHLGIIKYSTGLFADAAGLFEKALAANPGNANYYFSLALASWKLGRKDEAVRYYKQTLAMAPDNVAAWNNLGHLYLEMKDHESARKSFREVIRIDPGNLSAYQNLGLALISLRRYDEAIQSLLKAEGMKPDDEFNLVNLGDAYFKKKELKTAFGYMQKALDINPELHRTRLKYAEILLLLSYYDRSEAQLRQLLDKPPDIAKVALGILARVYEFKGELGRSAEYYRKVLELDPDFYPARQNYLYTISYNVLLSPRETLEAHREWNDSIHCDEKRLAFDWPRSRDVNPGVDRKLRVGYLSADFRRHPIGTLFESLLCNHDDGKFDIVCYASVVKPDDVTRRLMKTAADWVAVEHLDDRALADRIHDDDIDVLIDLAGHTGDTRLPALAYRPAPVQATYMGYCTTTGLATMDYWITDTVLHPDDTEELASERIFRLPRCWITYRPPAAGITPDVNERHDGPVRFGSFNQISKITARVISVWAEILKSVDQSRLFIKCFQLSDDNVRREIIARFAQHGIDEDRIELQGSDSQYMAAYHQVDIALDPFPRTGCLTTLDALWMGVPVITLTGKRFIERQGHSILAAIGRREWVAATKQEYIDKAVALAGQVTERSRIRKILREEMRNSPLLDGKSLAGALEAAFLEMWHGYLREVAAEHREQGG